MTKINRKLSFVLATFLAFALSSVPAAAEQTVVVFDVNAALANSKAGKSMASQLESQMKVVTDEAQKFDVRMAGEVEKLKEQRSLMAADALQGKVEELRLEELKKKQDIGKRQRAIQAGGQKAGQEILKVALEELAIIAKERNAALVVRRDAVFISSPGLDVTADVVSAIDKKLSDVKVKPIEVKE